MPLDAAIDTALKKFLASIEEHVEAVSIHVSWTEDGITNVIDVGCGNYYARKGMAQAFLEKDQARTQCDVQHEEYPPDDGEEYDAT